MCLAGLRSQLAATLRLANGKDTSMSNASDRAKGIVEKIGGTIKKKVGKAIGNEQMEAEGKAKELEGNARIAAAKARERGKGKVEEVVGVVKKEVGHVIGNEQMRAEGKATELKGEARQKANQ
jgi:uncharacterized protein YjbJ (UPF0337 family)